MKFLSRFLALVLILPCTVACNNTSETKAETESDSISESESSTESNTTADSEEETTVTDPYQKTTYTMKEAVGLYKPLGRTAIYGSSLTCDFPASGAEFKVDCRGDITINFTAEKDGQKLSVYIDGTFSREIVLSKGVSTYTVAETLSEGEHTIRVVAQYAYTTNTLNKIVLNGQLLPAEEKEVYIEFIGASSISGYGLSPTNENDATRSISYTAIELLDVDYSLFGMGGMGIAYSATADHTVNNKYPYQSINRNKDEYAPTRTPDIIVFNLGQNDNYQWYTQAQNNINHEKFNYETFDAAVAEFIGTLDKLYGEKKIPLVFVSGIITQESRSVATKRLEELINTVYVPAGYDILICPVTTDRSGYNSHSTPAGAKKQGEELADFIRKNFPRWFQQ